MPPIVISSQRGGRNGIDSPLDPLFPSNQATEMVNVELSDAPCGAKRGGATTVSTVGGGVFATGIRQMFRHVPGGDETAAEWFGVDGAGLIKRYSAGAWADVTLSDAITGSKSEVAFVTFNGKLFVFYKSGVNRCHVWDPNLAAPRIRRVGLDKTVAPTVANQGGGAYPATQRYYRQRGLQLDAATSTKIIRRSEPSPSVSFTPSGAGLSARITRAAFPGEQETHWEIDVSTDNLNFVKLVSFEQGTAIAIGTTTYDDTAVVGSYTALSVSDLLGTYTLFPSAKFGTTDGNRLIVAGSYETAEPSQSAIWYSPVLGPPDKGNDERWVNTATQKNKIILAENNGGQITGLTPTINGVFWAGKYRNLWRITPTGSLASPYLIREVSPRMGVGILNHWCIVPCQDAAGNPAIGFLSYQGPHRVGSGGLEYCGRDIEDVWRGLYGYAAAGPINLSASITSCHGLWYADKFQVYWWIATGANSSPNVRLRWNVQAATVKDDFGVRGGWMIDDGDVAAYCSSMFANTLGATVSKDLRPHTGRSDTTIYKHDTTDQKDNTTAFQSYVTTKCIIPDEGFLTNNAIADPIVVARAQAGSQLRVTLVADFELRTSNADAMLDPKRTETRVIRKIAGSSQSEAGAYQIRYGDALAIANKWAVDAIIVPVMVEGVK